MELSEAEKQLKELEDKIIAKTNELQELASQFQALTWQHKIQITRTTLLHNLNCVENELRDTWTSSSGLC